MRLSLRVLFILQVLLLSACSNGADPMRQKTVEIDDFGIVLSTGSEVAVRKLDVPEDFLAFVLSEGSKELLYLYVGNAPRFPNSSEHAHDSMTRSVGKNYERSCISWKEESGSSGECLIDISKHRDFPQFLHFIYGSLSGTERKKAEEIINSIMVE